MPVSTSTSSVIFTFSELSSVFGYVAFTRLAELFLSCQWTIFWLFCRLSFTILLSLRLCLFCLRLCDGWSRWRSGRFFPFDLVVDEDSQFLQFAIMYLLHDFDLIHLSFFIHHILLYNYNLVSVGKSSGNLLHCWLFSMLCDQRAQCLLQLVVVGALFQQISDVSDGLIQVAGLNRLDAAPQSCQLDMFWELRVGHEDCECPCEQLKFSELLCSEQFCIFSVSFFIESYVVFHFLSFLDDMLFALHFLNLFRLEVLLVLQFCDLGESLVEVPYFFVDHPEERFIFLIQCGLFVFGIVF